MSLNLEQARFNMVEQQVRTWEVLDLASSTCCATVPREDFVPSRYRKLAFADLRIPLVMARS
jgi:protein-L-isoaspartate(D-aspartate) O-methyltransferase